MRGSDGIDELTEFLGNISRELSDITPFFTAHEVRYLEIARRGAWRVLLAHRPEAMDADEWEERAGEFCDLIFSAHLPAAFEIVYAGATEFRKLGMLAAGANPGTVQPIGYQDVLDWVEAGPEHGGKDITDEESARGLTPEQIALNVNQAIHQLHLGEVNGGKDYARIESRIAEFLDSRSIGGDLGTLMDLILEAWETDLAPVIERDFEEWVSIDVFGE